jgi:hypothetical protein
MQRQNVEESSSSPKELDRFLRTLPSSVALLSPSPPLPTSSLSSISAEMVTELVCFPLNGNIFDAVSLLIRHNPGALLLYAKTYIRTTDDWREVIKLLVEEVEKRSSSDGDAPSMEGTPGQGAALLHSLSELLYSLACDVAFDDYVSLLPEKGSVSFFLPFIEVALQRRTEIQIKSDLLEKARDALLKEMDETAKEQ